MKKRITAAVLSLLLLLTSTTYALSAGIGGFRYAGAQPLADNLTYRNTVAWRDDLGREEAYSLTLVPGYEARAAVAFGGSLYGRLPVNDVIAEAESRGLNVLAAINADFFSMQTGVPLGIVIDDYIYKSSPEEENALAFRPDGTMFFAGKTDVTMAFRTANGETVPVTHLNKMRNALGGMYLLTEGFADGMTRTSGKGWFVRMKILYGELRLGTEMTLEVMDVFSAVDDVPVGENCVILTGTGDPPREYSLFAPGDVITMQTRCENEQLISARYALGGGDIIVSDGAVTDSALWDKDLLVRSPKTAVGYRADGTIVALAVDGRNEKYANGLTLSELAEEMRDRGCVAAMNLDGGGSTILSVRKPGSETASYVNRPSDGSPRKCSTYIIFVTDGVNDGIPRNLGLTNNGVAVLAGSGVELSALATDSARMPAQITPDDVVFTSERTAGAVLGSTYHASGEQGADRITMYSPSFGIGGWGEVFVVTHPTSVYFADENGVAIAGMTISGGRDIQLNPQATYHRILLASQPEAYTFTVEGDVGTVTPDGVLHVSNGGTGRITVQAGEQSAVIDVTVGFFEDMVGHWAARFVHALYDDGVVRGVADTLYAPESQIKRGDFLLMLYRAVNSLPVPEIPEETVPPEDVTPPEETVPPDDITPPDEVTPPEETDSAPWEDPASTAEPSPTDEPSPTPEPSPSDEPSPTSEPSPTDEPSPTSEPTPTDEPSPTPEPTPEPPPEPPFADVDWDAYYAEAVAWAKDHGVAQGTGNGLFNPTAPLTREQAFTFVYRALSLLTITYETADGSRLSPFADATDVTDYATAPTATLVSLGVVEGANGRLNPKGVLKRSEMAKLLYAILENVHSFG